MIELVLNERGELGRADGKQMLKSTRQFGMTRVTKEDLPHIEAYKHALTLDYEPPANLAGDGLIYVLYDTNAKAHVGLTIAITSSFAICASTRPSTAATLAPGRRRALRSRIQGWLKPSSLTGIATA